MTRIVNNRYTRTRLIRKTQNQRNRFILLLLLPWTKSHDLNTVILSNIHGLFGSEVIIDVNPNRDTYSLNRFIRLVYLGQKNIHMSL